MIKTEQELKDKIAKCTHCLDIKFSGENGKRAIVVCGGTGCLSSHSDEIKNRLEELIKEHNLEDKVRSALKVQFDINSITKLVVLVSVLKDHLLKFSQKILYIIWLK